MMRTGRTISAPAIVLCHYSISVTDKATQMLKEGIKEKKGIIKGERSYTFFSFFRLMRTISVFINRFVGEWEGEGEAERTILGV